MNSNSIKNRLNKITHLLHFDGSVKLNNKKFTIPLIKDVGVSNIFLKEDWFVRLIKALNLPSDTDFIDVGVNLGQSLLAFRSCNNNPYWGFEPNPTCIFYLESLIKINKLEKTTILPIGLSSKNELLKLYLKNNFDSCATIIEELRPHLYDVNESIHVPTFSFDSLKIDMNKISLIKIDVEGAELEVIRGMAEAIEKHQPVVICEILDSHLKENIPFFQVKATKIFEFFRGMKYKKYRILHENKTKIELEEIEDVIIKKWSSSSLYSNDYLFLPEPVRSLPNKISI